MKWHKYKNEPKISHFSWGEYIIVLIAMGFFSVFPVLMFGGIQIIKETSSQFLLWILLFWAAVALMFCLVTAWQKYQAFDKPMKMLGEAGRRVAQGDFSVYLKPLHPSKSQCYVDYMFEDFNKMVEELGSLEMMKSDFISNVSHEFKTPLAAIQNYATDLKYLDLPQETQQEYLNVIISSASNLNTLVTNILRLNKIEHQMLPSKKEKYDLCQQLCDCCISFENQWDEKEIDFSAEIEDQRMIVADSELLSLVWNNLLSNAIKFTNSKGIIVLRQSYKEGMVEVSITDSGCGMDEETIEHIFDKFYQGDTSRVKQGNGLGLALVKRVLELCDGTIKVQSEVGKGTTFTVILSA